MLLKKGKPEDAIISHLGKGAELTGEISFTNGLRVEGNIKGKIRSEAILEIGPGGRVDAEVHIRKIIVNGEFHGIIHASDRVEIHKDGKVFGDIYSPCLIIEAGATFDGHCNMRSEKKPVSQKEENAPLKTTEANTQVKEL
ncbi:MAG: polymer-forming cytoskeletal protein [Acidobacteriota bacterium]|jgi:cytoskeletal protein CcmA (bactofilin family)|nr:polymer-forming cytoskeletal protein [Acidobacteriota bacterium]